MLVSAPVVPPVILCRLRAGGDPGRGFVEERQPGLDEIDEQGVGRMRILENRSAGPIPGPPPPRNLTGVGDAALPDPRQRT